MDRKHLRLPIAAPVALVSSVFGLTLGAWAGTTEMPPEITSAVPGLSPVATIGTLDVLASPDNDMIWVHDPETGSVLAGYGFDSQGRSLNQGHPVLGNLTLSDFLAVKAAGSDGELPLHPPVEGLLDGMEPEQREAALADLIERMRNAKDEASFNKAASEWIEGLAGSPEEETSLLQAMQQARAIDLGEPGAQLVYMLTDPLCLPCGVALKQAAELAEQGEISLKLVLAPLVSEDSHGVIAGILAQEDPLKAILALGDEDAAIPFAPYAYLDAESQEALAFNRAIAASGAIEQIPLFAWEAGGAENYAVSLEGFAERSTKIEAPSDTAEDTEAAVMPEAGAE